MKATYELKPKLTMEEIEAIQRRFHFEKTALPHIARVCGEIEWVMEARAFTSIKTQKEAVTVITLGVGVDNLQERYQSKEQMLESYIVECAGMELLQKAYDLWADSLYKETGCYPLTMEFYGEEHSFEDMKEAFSELGQKTVSCNEAYMMSPKKSTAFVSKLGEKPDKECNSPCAACTNVRCENRQTEELARQTEELARQTEELARQTGEPARGMLHVYCGNGKGKTTAALGLSIRALGAGKRVVFVQFMKGRDTSELNSLSKLDYIKVIRNDKDFGFYKDMTETKKEQTAIQHNRHLETAMEMINAGQCDMLVLDEVTYPYEYRLIDRELLEKLIINKPKELELVITGRKAPEFILKQADYITNMECVRHPFEKGIPAREGIEY